MGRIPTVVKLGNTHGSPAYRRRRGITKAIRQDIPTCDAIRHCGANPFRAVVVDVHLCVEKHWIDVEFRLTWRYSCGLGPEF